MGLLLTYNLKVSICLILLFFAYKLFLGKNTLHRLNRVTLMSIYFISVLCPLITFDINPTAIHETVQSYETSISEQILNAQDVLFDVPLVLDKEVQTDLASSYNINWVNAIILIYIIGVAFLSAGILVSLRRIYLLSRNGEKIQHRNSIIVLHNKDIEPFSWMKYIILSKEDYEGFGESVLSHEQAHVKHLHSLDLIVSNLLTIFQWYNPVIWLMKKELQDIHEFEADNFVLSSGIEPKQYQLLLIKKAAGTRYFNMIINEFTHSSLKKRIAMMLKEKSKPWLGLRYLVLLPFIATAIMLFSCKKVTNNLDSIAAADITSIVEETEPVEGAWIAVSGNNLKSSKIGSVKIITNGKFFWFRYNKQTNQIFSGAGGTYTYKDRVYTETILYTLPQMEPWKEKKAVYDKISLSQNGATYQGLLDGSVQIKEEWQRLSADTALQRGIKTEIEGAWITQVPEDASIEMVKLISGNAFAWFHFDKDGNIQTGAGGTYTYKDGVCVENILYTHPDRVALNGLLGHIDVDIHSDKMLADVTIGAYRAHEIWTRFE